MGFDSRFLVVRSAVQVLGLGSWRVRELRVREGLRLGLGLVLGLRLPRQARAHLWHAAPRVRVSVRVRVRMRVRVRVRN